MVGFGDLGGRVGSALPSEDLKVARLPFVRAEACRRKINNKLAIFNVLPDKFCVGFLNREFLSPRLRMRLYYRLCGDFIDSLNLTSMVGE